MKHWICAAFLLAGCQSAQKVFDAPQTKEQPEIQRQQEQSMLEGERRLEIGDFSGAEELYKAYLKRSPISYFTAQAYYGLGRSLEFQGKWNEALEVYRTLANQGRELRPDLAGLALYRQAYCYEALGDEVRTMTSLQDAEALSAHLPNEVKLIEIPAKKAASLLRKGELKEAQKLLTQVNAAVPGVFLLAENPRNAEMARVFLQIGSLSLEPVNSQNYLVYLESFQSLQIYLWRAFKLNEGQVSQDAERQLLGTLQKFWQMAQELPVELPGLDPEAASRVRTEIRRKWAGAFLKALSALKLYAGDDLQLTNSAGLPQQIAALDQAADQMLYGDANRLPLTPESEKLNSIFRPGTVLTTPFFPPERRRLR